MTEEVYTRDEEKSLKVGLWVALSIILIVGLISSARQKITHVDSGAIIRLWHVSTGRTDLLVGDLVRLAGVNVGKVVDAKLDDDFKAILTLEIKDNIQLPDDSSSLQSSARVMRVRSTLKSNRACTDCP